ncbi:MAG: glutamate-5-semialdehyde dehydrogenase [Candidatus Pacebacteria bacterium]|nr:glutamate-5-semialdehyde dehydrogenase [Candidatus Paceibacterota bacterium]
MTANELKKNIADAKRASTSLLILTALERREVLLKLAELLERNSGRIIVLNQKDISIAKQNGKADSFIERLSLDKNKIIAMANATRAVAKQQDILFKTLEQRRRPNGLLIKKVRFPLGLVAMIYESRPNVTIDAFTLSFKSGNALLLKGGKEILFTNKILVRLIHEALATRHIDTNVVKNLSGLDKKFVIELMSNPSIDCLIPRGGKNLIDFVRKYARVPVIVTGASVVHTYVDSDANIESATRIILNAKMRRVSICNALDVVLLHRKVYAQMLRKLGPDLAEKRVQIRADRRSFDVLKKSRYPYLKHALAKDFDTEFLDYVLAIKVVNNFEEALQHISEHSLGHSEAIITRSKKHAEVFFRTIDAACLYLNTSTQFSDGGEFGMGGEIGISTQKLHARGPFSALELTTYKYLVKSDGAIRK